MAEKNLTTRQELQLKSVDFVNQFTSNLSTLLKLLQVTRKTPLKEGETIKTYKTTVVDSGETAGEGEDIPLTQIKRELADTYQMEYIKKRKATTYEAIQAAGYNQAVTLTDNALIGLVQKEFKSKMFNPLKNGTGKAQGDTFQKALANSLGQLSATFEDTDTSGSTIAFVNPLDFYEYLGETPITVQTIFGLNYIQGYLGFTTIIMTTEVPQGEIWATVGQNLNLYYSKASDNGFDAYTDQTGYISILRDQINKNLTLETVATAGVAIFPERVDGIVKSTIGKKAANTK